MAGYSTLQLIFAVHQFLLSESVTATQRAFKIRFNTPNAPSVKVIKRCVKNFQTTGNISPRKPTGRPRNVRTEQNVEAIRGIVEMTPKSSVR